MTSCTNSTCLVFSRRSSPPKLDDRVTLTLGQTFAHQLVPSPLNLERIACFQVKCRKFIASIAFSTLRVRNVNNKKTYIFV